MKLIDLLVQELPKRGGWPGQAYLCRTYSHIPDACFWDDNGVTVPFESLGKRALGDDAVTRDQYEAALAASKQVEWSGEGLPPVGAECGARKKSPGAGWWNFKVEHLSSGCVFGFWKKSGVGAALDADEYDFMPLNPIRTEAERKREYAIKALEGWISEGYSPSQIYDLAIAKGEIPGIKLED